VVVVFAEFGTWFCLKIDTLRFVGFHTRRGEGFFQYGEKSKVHA
jgi:hypothetical protein